MTGLILAIIIPIVAVSAYLLLGWRLALRALPRAWEKARRAWHYDDFALGSVKAQTLTMVLAWPVLLPVRAISDTMDRVVDEADPKVLARKLREREARIRELERELGIGS